jgi:co-chaperonin GroES (HSP10)
MPEFGYRPTPLRDRVFVKPVPVEHPSHFIVPDAYEPATSIGFVHSVGPDAVGIKPGNLVIYDKYAVTGSQFELLDEDNETVSMVCLSSDFIFAVLERVKLNA